MKFTQYELYDLINRPGPLWLANVDLSDANLREKLVSAAGAEELHDLIFGWQSSAQVT